MAPTVRSTSTAPDKRVRSLSTLPSTSIPTTQPPFQPCTAAREGSTKVPGGEMASCCVFLRWPSTSPSRLGYRSLDDGEAAGSSSPAVTVVVGKERRVFSVDQLLLDTYPFRLLLETAVRKEESKAALFVDADAILFEHILWLACHHDRSSVSLLHLDLKEIIDFYSQDA